MAEELIEELYRLDGLANLGGLYSTPTIVPVHPYVQGDWTETCNPVWDMSTAFGCWVDWYISGIETHLWPTGYEDGPLHDPDYFQAGSSIRPHIASTSPLLHEGKDKKTQIYTVSSVDSQHMESTRQAESSRTCSQQVTKTKKRKCESNEGEGPRKKGRRPLASPAMEDTGGTFAEYRVDPVGLEIYKPLRLESEFTKSGRIRAGKLIKTIGKDGEEGTRFKFYGNCKGG